jgi:hypothetical protein
MTTLELAKLVRDSGCEVNISPSETYNAVYITARNKDKVIRYGFAMESAFSDLEEILDHTIKMAVYQVKDTKQ